MFGLFKKSAASPDRQHMEQIIHEGAFLVDVRTPAEFSAGSVSGAVNIPLDKLQAHLSRLKDKKHIVVFCRSGNRSSMAVKILKAGGISQVVDGGTWQDVDRMLKTKAH